MSNFVIREVSDNELETSKNIIRDSFATVAKNFNLTKENCPTNGAFIELERLTSDRSKGIKMFGLFVDNKQAGFVAVAKQSSFIYEMEKLAVLPQFRHNGYGKALMDHVKEYVKAQQGEIVSIGIIDENSTLKEWYTKYGFIDKGTRTFSHLPFTVCFMELNI